MYRIILMIVVLLALYSLIDPIGTKPAIATSQQPQMAGSETDLAWIKRRSGELLDARALNFDTPNTHLIKKYTNRMIQYSVSCSQGDAVSCGQAKRLNLLISHEQKLDIQPRPQF